VDQSTAKAQRLWARVAVGSFDVFDQGRLSILADPLGAYFAMWQARKHIGSRVGDLHNRHCWSELATTDAVKARRFYTQCAQCHTNNNYKLTSAACITCHLNDYNGTTNPNHKTAGLPQDCTLCHNTTNFTSATFNHATTGFALTGAHTPLQCAQCHTNNNYKDRKSVV
jgi:predicted enzyme related to lactoylglutathione lyase